MDTCRFRWSLSLLLPTLFFSFCPDFSLGASFDHYIWVKGSEGDEN